MLSERRNHGRIHVNLLVWLGSLNVLFPVDELVSHNHAIHFYNDDWNSSDGNHGTYNQPGIVHDSVDRSPENTNRWTDLVEDTGGNKPFNIMQPYQTVYIFKRSS